MDIKGNPCEPICPEDNRNGSTTTLVAADVARFDEIQVRFFWRNGNGNWTENDIVVTSLNESASHSLSLIWQQEVVDLADDPFGSRVITRLIENGRLPSQARWIERVSFGERERERAGRGRRVNKPSWNCHPSPKSVTFAKKCHCTAARIEMEAVQSPDFVTLGISIGPAHESRLCSGPFPGCNSDNDDAWQAWVRWSKIVGRKGRFGGWPARFNEPGRLTFDMQRRRGTRSCRTDGIAVNPAIPVNSVADWSVRTVAITRKPRSFDVLQTYVTDIPMLTIADRLPAYTRGTRKLVNSLGSFVDGEADKRESFALFVD
ncbi:hypothetical protein WN48_09317 [Eufriesea mexicana]|nr:hypothetical protein WN48_09317 [Eufriesea mexicana]